MLRARVERLLARGRGAVGQTAPATESRVLRIAILGAGAGGLGLGIRLRQSGIESFTIYERSDGVGGTWRDNSYPGAGCDVPSHLYSFSFAPNPRWSHVFSEQAEILAYLEGCADRFGIRPHLRCNTEVVEARWDDLDALWRLRTRAGELFEAEIVVSALGQLNVPAYPDVPGLEEFVGTAFHSARWDHGHDLTGQRVGVIGNGASAVQFVPRIAADVARLTVFQRSANWIVPRPDAPYPEWMQDLFARVDPVRRLHRGQIFAALELRWWALREGSRRARSMASMAHDQLVEQIVDRPLREKLTPDYPIGCKRILISSDYYPALARDDVEVVTDAITRIGAKGVVTADGRERPVDTLIFATGFRSTEFLSPVDVIGRHGRQLHEEWSKGAAAYLGVAAPGYPNLFLLYGPNTNLGHNSIIFMMECQIDYILRALTTMRAEGARALEVRADALDAYEAQVQAAVGETVWEAGCHSWYKTDAGRVTNNWPRPASAYWWLTQRTGFAAFDRRRAPANTRT